MKNKIWNLFIVFGAGLILASCAPLVIGGVGATGVLISQERSVGDALDDAAIWTRINNEMIEEDKNLFVDVSVKVNEGRVLLTGEVKSPAARAKAVQIAWDQKGVREVINEIAIRGPEGKHPILDYSKDSFITAQVKAKLLAEKEVVSVNYSIDTVNGVVYIMGVAKTQAEIKKVNYLASTVKGVKRVVNYARLWNSPNRK